MTSQGIPEIDGFTFIKELGRGAMATVWEARQHDPDRVVAIKLLRDDITGSPEEVESFYAEAKRAAELDHENIVTVFEVGCQRGFYYYVMELASGYDTAKWLRRKGHLKQDDVLTIAESVAIGLDYAEKTIGLIHCDIKPGNIMVDGDGTVRITDLGIARLARGSNPDDGYICGTPSFMSPEQAKGEKLDARADIYSLGATMYTLLTGHRLFDGRTDAEIMEAQCNEYVSDVREFNPEVTYQLAALLSQMLSKDRSERPQNWPTVIDSIRKVISGEPPIGAIPGDSTMKLEEFAKTPTMVQTTPPMTNRPEPELSVGPADNVASNANSGNGVQADPDKDSIKSKPAKPKTVRVNKTYKFAPKGESHATSVIHHAQGKTSDTTATSTNVNSQAASPQKSDAPSAPRTEVRLASATSAATVKRVLPDSRAFVVYTTIASAVAFILAYLVTKFFITR